jgi:hypothetical protein
MNVTNGRTSRIINLLTEKYGDVEGCRGYGEAGYCDPEAGIIFANWNDISQRIQDYLELAGHELEWIDEWVIDYDCDKAYRCQPDSYHWAPSYMYTEEGEMLTPEDDLSEWVEELELTDYAQPIKPLPAFMTNKDKLADLGYIKHNEDELESGFHYGQNDSPEDIAKKLFDNYSSVLFTMAETSQFYIKFDVYVKNAV